MYRVGRALGSNLLKKASVRILLADDFDSFRCMVAAMLGEQPGLDVIAVAADGLAAVQKAEQLQPDLIILDISLPMLNGIEAARWIRRVSPESTILFLSGITLSDVAEEALRTGAVGYVVKVDAGKELLLAINAVLGGKQFISRSVSPAG